MGLAYSLTSYEHREILLKDRPQSLYDISPKGTVPVLLLEDGMDINLKSLIEIIHKDLRNILIRKL